MTWGAPFALLGVAAVALPILIHLFTRRHTRRVTVPSLRFVRPALTPPRRTARLEDALLLALRAAAFVLAALALARPTRIGERDAQPARPLAIVIDTSASVRRTVVELRATADSVARVRREAIGVALGAAREDGLVLETGLPRAGVRIAAAWLAERGGVGELVVLSDFQFTSLAPADLRALPPGVTVRLLPQASRVATRGGAGLALPGLAHLTMRVAEGTPQRDRALAALNVAETMFTPTTTRTESPDSAPSLTLVFADTPERDTWIRDRRPLTDVFLARRVAAALSDSTFLEDWPSQLPPIVVGNAATGAPFIFAPVVATSWSAVSLAAALYRGGDAHVADAEADPRRWSAAQIARALTEDTSGTGPARGNAASVGAARDSPGGSTVASHGDPSRLSRWLWGAVLAVLALEWIVRRRAPMQVQA
ncbi:MAG: hypothetical protein FJ202_08645 [Gemmatimonadetes bacterium]|nr:hypothetical protein [Gemmatimonadota bacterium]